MEKLELKHLAPYLPYGLKGAEKVFEPSPEHTPTYTLGTLHDPKYHDEWSWWVGKNKVWHVNLKPILRPLSDLTKEIEHDTVDDYATGFGLDKETIQKFIDKGVINAAIWNFDYTVWQKMFEYHFDVFGLIPKGLAIDINTLNK